MAKQPSNRKSTHSVAATSNGSQKAKVVRKSARSGEVMGNDQVNKADKAMTKAWSLISQRKK